MGKKRLTGDSGVDLRGIDETASTLYIPKSLLKGMGLLIRRKKLERDGLRGLLRLLLDEYEVALAMGVVRQSEKGKKVYQKRGLDLKKMNFHPANGDWAELTLHGHSLGYARNLIFVRLLTMVLELEGLLQLVQPRKPHTYIKRKVKKLKYLVYSEFLDLNQHLRRKFAHGT